MSDTENDHGRNVDGTFRPGHKLGFQPGNPGRPKGVSQRDLIRHIADELAQGNKSYRELMIDTGFVRAINGESDVAWVYLMRMLDETAHEIDLRIRAIISTDPAVDMTGFRLAIVPTNGTNGNGNGKHLESTDDSTDA